MVGFLRSQEIYAALDKSAKATEQSLKLLTISFEEGDIDFSSVFLLQRELVAAQNQLALAQGAVVTNLIKLYKALGGGWEVRCRGFGSQPPSAISSEATMPPMMIEEVPRPIEPLPLDDSGNEESHSDVN